MASTLAHGVARRRPVGWRTAARVATGAAVLLLLVARDGDGDPLMPDRVVALRPAEAGTYRTVGTERDSRTGRTTATAGTFRVDPWFEVDGVRHQVVRSGGEGGPGEAETAFRPDGAVRLRESRDGVSWWWEPPLRTLAAPLSPGRSWTATATATVPDVAGYRRVRSVEARTEVVRTTTVDVGRRRVRAFVLDSWVRTTVTSTRRSDRSVTTTTYTTNARSWFSPAHMLVVRRNETTTVVGDPAAPGAYEVTRSVELRGL